MTLILVCPNREGLLITADKRSQFGGTTEIATESRCKLVVSKNATIAFSTQITQIGWQGENGEITVDFDAVAMIDEWLRDNEVHDGSVKNHLAPALAQKFNAAAQVCKLPTGKNGEVAMQTVLLKYLSGVPKAWLALLRFQGKNVDYEAGIAQGFHYSISKPMAFGRMEVFSAIDSGIHEPFSSMRKDPALSPMIAVRETTFVDLLQARNCATRLISLSSENLESFGFKDSVGTLIDEVLMTPSGMQTFPPRLAEELTS